MTGSCAQRRHWSRLRAWTTRAVATAGIAGGAWLLGAGIATASPELGHTVGGEPFAVAVAPSIDPDLLAAAEDGEPTAEEDRAEQLGVADLATDISSDVHEQLDEVDATEVAEPAPESEAERPDPEPEVAEPAAAPRTPERAPAPRAEPPPPPAVAEQSATAAPALPEQPPDPPHRDSPPDLADEAPAPQPMPPMPQMPPPAPTATALVTSTSPGHGLRWSHAVLPLQPRLPAAELAFGGHADAVVLRGTALIEPSAAPD